MPVVEGMARFSCHTTDTIGANEPEMPVSYVVSCWSFNGPPTPPGHVPADDAMRVNEREGYNYPTEDWDKSIQIGIHSLNHAGCTRNQCRIGVAGRNRQ